MRIKIIVTIGMCITLRMPEIVSQNIDTSGILQQIDSLTEVAYKYIRESRYESAHVVYRDALKFAISTLGEDHLHIGQLRHMLGLLYSDTRYSSDTKYQFLESLRIKRLHLPPDDPSIALTLMHLGTVYEEEGNLYMAEKYYVQARDIWVKYGSIQEEQFGSVQHHLGRIYAQQTRDKEALECLRDALRIKESVLGLENPELGHLLNLLASIYLRQGSYAAYEVCALRAADIWNKQRGIDDLLYYHSRHNLAVIHELMGNYALALSLGNEAVAGKRKILGPNDPDVALSLITLATIHAASGHQDSITVLLETAREILEKEIELYRLEYSWVLHNLGRIFISNHDFLPARTYLAKALGIKVKLVGTENLDYRSTLIAYANALMHTQATDTARVLLGQQREFYEYNQLTTHVDYLHCLELLSDIAVQEQRYDDAKAFLQTVNRINRQRISSLSEYASEQEMYAYIGQTKPAFHKYLSLGFSAAMMKPEMRRELYELVLFYKGFVLDRYFEIRNHIMWDPVSLGVFRSLVAQKRILAEQNEKLLHERKGITEIEHEISRLEAELAGTLQTNQRSGATFEKVRDALKSDEAAAEYVEYNERTSVSPGIVRYGAILVRPTLADPVFIPLTESEQLRGTVVISGTPGRDYVAEIYEKGTDHLSQMIWKPIEPWLSGVKLVYVAPAGLLHRINFDAIEVHDERLLRDTYDIVRCLSTAQAGLVDAMTYDNPDCAVFGGIDYDFDTSAVFARQTISGYPGFVYDESGGMAQTDSALRGGGWTFLKGSEREIREIDRILQGSQLNSSVYRGRQATEEQFKSLGRSRTRLRSPRVLHLSTHGYFFSDPLDISEHLTRSDGAPIFRSSDHPMVRSGLVLAGANYAWENGHAYRNGMDDGILTAYEISLMDLSDTELVVLSACETGLGDLAGNEGVLGLQRAFKIAGAKNLIMSLWRVPDAATAQLMTLFYQNWLERRMSARHALTAAQKEMREHGWEHFYWAGFVIVE